MKKPKVSILIPTYNRANYIGQAIESAVSQDYDNYEVLVSDNASIDNTKKVIKPFLKDKRLHFYPHEENKGPLENWHRLLYEYAKGEWIIFLGSDDYFIDPQYLSKAMKLVDENPECICCHANFRYLYEETERSRDTQKQCPEITDGMWYFWDLSRMVMIHISNFLFRRDIAQKLRIIDRKKPEDEYVGGDAEIIGKFILSGKVGFVKTVANAYRYHGENATFTSDLIPILNFFNCINTIYNYGISRFPEKIKSFKAWKYKSNKHFVNSYSVTLLKLNKRKGLEFLYKSLQRYPWDTIAIFLIPTRLIRLMLSIFLPTPLYAKMQNQYSSKKTIYH